MAAQRFGVSMAEEAVTQWNRLRPDDPEIVESFANLLLEHGQGRSDAERAYELLRPAVDHFPFHLGLRLSLVQACRKLSKEAEDGLREIVRRHPDNSNARIQLAWVHELHGQGNQARSQLEEAKVSDPQNPQISDTLVQILIRHRQLDQAKKLVLSTLESAPRDVTWRDRAIKLLLECGDEEGAVTAARAGVNLYPRRLSVVLVGGNSRCGLPIMPLGIAPFARQGDFDLFRTRSCYFESDVLSPVLHWLIRNFALAGAVHGSTHFLEVRDRNRTRRRCVKRPGQCLRP